MRAQDTAKGWPEGWLVAAAAAVLSAVMGRLVGDLGLFAAGRSCFWCSACCWACSGAVLSHSRTFLPPTRRRTAAPPLRKNPMVMNRKIIRRLGKVAIRQRRSTNPLPMRRVWNLSRRPFLHR